ncbi:MAG: hydrogenase 4 subunit F [Elusimicrobiota bacterium]
MQALFILLIPLILAILPAFVKSNKNNGIANIAGYTLALGIAVVLASHPSEKLLFLNFFYIDALSMYFMLTVTVINLATALYSTGYIQNDLDKKVISQKKARLYYVLFNIFTFTMLLVTVLNNLGIVWVAIEMTTLTSAFLVGFYNDKKSVEAAWKYIIICSVGLTLAFLGTILFYYTVSKDGGMTSLNWTDMVSVIQRLNPQVLKIAFLFIIVGYGTKAGLAPMHTWLPDAHSQALAPISALLSGVLLKISFYAILRFSVIVNQSIGSQFTGRLFIIFGLISLGISAGFILLQKDIKRLLAYHSVEHIGIIAFGTGIGGELGLFGALLHVFNHAATKALMFFSAGNIIKQYDTHNMHLIKGVIKTMPFTGFFALTGAFALGGLPPFSIFLSELIILIAGFTKGAVVASCIFLVFLATIFGALIFHFSKTIFGPAPEGAITEKVPLTTKISFLLLFTLIVLLGIYIPQYFGTLITSAAAVLQGA